MIHFTPVFSSGCVPSPITKCSLCHNKFKSDEKITRLACEHFYHLDCFSELDLTSPNSLSKRCAVCKEFTLTIARLIQKVLDKDDFWKPFNIPTFDREEEVYDFCFSKEQQSFVKQVSKEVIASLKVISESPSSSALFDIEQEKKYLKEWGDWVKSEDPDTIGRYAIQHVNSQVIIAPEAETSTTPSTQSADEAPCYPETRESILLREAAKRLLFLKLTPVIADTIFENPIAHVIKTRFEAEVVLANCERITQNQSPLKKLFSLYTSNDLRVLKRALTASSKNKHPLMNTLERVVLIKKIAELFSSKGFILSSAACLATAYTYSTCTDV